MGHCIVSCSPEEIGNEDGCISPAYATLIAQLIMA